MGSDPNSSNNNNSKGRQIPIVCPGHTRPLAELQFCQVTDDLDHGASTTTTLLVSACHDRMPMLRHGTTGDWIGTFAGHKGAVWSCRLDPTGNLAATASGDFSARVWDAITGKSLYTFPHRHIVKTCDFSPNSRYLATGGHEGIIRIYDLTRSPKQLEEPIQEVPVGGGVAGGADKTVIISKCNWLSDSQLLVGCADGAIRAFSFVNGQLQLVDSIQTEDAAEIRDMEIVTTTTGDMKRILTVAAGTKVYFYNLSDYSLIHVYKMPIHFKDEGGASLHPSGTKFVAGGSDLWVRVFDFATGEELECLKGHHGPIRCLRYSPDGQTYATGSEDGTIRLWKTDAPIA